MPIRRESERPGPTRLCKRGTFEPEKISTNKTENEYLRQSCSPFVKLVPFAVKEDPIVAHRSLLIFKYRSFAGKMGIIHLLCNEQHDVI